MRVKNCPVYSRNSQKFSSKKKGRDSGPGCRASKLLDLRPLLHLFLEAVSLRPETCWLFILRVHFHIGRGQCIVSLDFHFLQEWAAKEQKNCDFHTFCYVPCPYGGVAPNIENRSLLYTFLGFKAHSTKNRTRIAYATVENGCVKNRLLVTVSGVAMDTTSSAPEKKCAPQNKSTPQKNRDVPLAPRQPLPGQGFRTTRQSSNQERDRTLPLLCGLKHRACYKEGRAHPRRAAQTLLSRRSSSLAAAIASPGKASLSSCSPNVGCSGVL